MKLASGPPAVNSDAASKDLDKIPPRYGLLTNRKATTAYEGTGGDRGDRPGGLLEYSQKGKRIQDIRARSYET